MNTPAYWKALKYNDDLAIGMIETVERGSDLPDEGYPIAKVYCAEDMNLIAAAPELLDALIALADTLAVNNPRSKGWDAYTQARAAIAKAQG
jgi:hypothetical protein